jgi:exodeoxyribonuclease V alpha subunit
MVARILALLGALQEESRQLQAALVAPTGKATARLAEALRQAKTGSVGSDGTGAAVATRTATVHRLLKPVAGTTHFRHTRENPLDVDILVVDEASMVDLALMTKLVAAVPEHARLILLGDPDQLASVEAGSVLSDLCGTKARSAMEKSGSRNSPGIKSGATDPIQASNLSLAACIVFLQRNFRFDQNSGIGGLSERIRRGDAEGVCALLRDPAEADLDWKQSEDPRPLLDFIQKRIASEYRHCLQAADPLDALQRYRRFQILCAVNGGPLGVVAVNRLAERLLLKQPGFRRTAAGSGPWFKGRPILVTQNDYDLNLYNGDIGMTWNDPEPDTNRLSVYFPDNEGGLRRFGLQRLPPHAAAFAVTVHKAQGSEFDRVLLVLPEKDYPVLHRELLYTAATRSRRGFSLAGPEGTLRLALGRSGVRGSGLSECLWEGI